MEFKSYVGMGNLCFGMTEDEVHAVMGDLPRKFMKSQQSKHTTDAFPKRGVHVYYTETGRCEAIELFPPAAFRWNGRDLFDLPANEARSILAATDPSLVDELSGFVSFALGLPAVLCG
jgi:hypothetical protein